MKRKGGGRSGVKRKGREGGGGKREIVEHAVTPRSFWNCEFPDFAQIYFFIFVEGCRVEQQLNIHNGNFGGTIV